MTSPAADSVLPYKLACLCDLRDEQGRILLLRRLKAPNQGLCSPIGGKLDMASGESPALCAQREIEEEAGIHVPLDRLHLLGLVSERAFEGRGHWLLFFYRVMGPVEVTPRDMREGRLEWHHEHELSALPLPETDRQIIWPLVRRHEGANSGGAKDERHGFFAAHIDCSAGGLEWTLDQSMPPGRT